jgi:hypothetical protein
MAHRRPSTRRAQGPVLVEPSRSEARAASRPSYTDRSSGRLRYTLYARASSAVEAVSIVSLNASSASSRGRPLLSWRTAARCSKKAPHQIGLAAGSADAAHCPSGGLPRLPGLGH